MAEKPLCFNGRVLCNARVFLRHYHHPQTILATLIDVEKQPEWDESVTQGEYIAYPTTTDETSYPVKVDLVSFTLSKQPLLSEIIFQKMKFALASTLEFITRGSYKAKKPSNAVLVARNWRIDEDQSCWLFNRSVAGESSLSKADELWSYFFMQPVLDSESRSIVHIIICNSCDSKPCPERMAARLVALKQYFEMQTLRTKPLKHASLRHVADSRALREADILARESLMGSEVGSVSGSVSSIYHTLERSSQPPTIHRLSSSSMQKLPSSPTSEGAEPSPRWSLDSSSAILSSRKRLRRKTRGSLPGSAPAATRIRRVTTRV